MRTKSTRRLRARAAAVHSNAAEFDDYGPEPNMKLSHAFLVVLLLHVIAVGGLYAFNTMKASKAPKLSAASAANLPDQPATPQQENQSPEHQGNAPEGLGKKPSSGKAPVVAKTSEAPKVSEGSSKPSAQAVTKEAHSPATSQNTAMEARTAVAEAQPKKGLLSGIKAALLRLGGVSSGAGVATAVAQDAAPVQTPDATAPAVETPNALGAAKTYVVKSGDSITKIASTLGVTIPDLEKVNGLTGSAVLHVGQMLKVPEKLAAQTVATVADQTEQVVQGAQQLPGSIAAAAAAATGSIVGTGTVSGSGTSTSGGASYTVAKGDNPYKIAKKFKITPDELMKANNITDPKKIQIGQKLIIPASHKKTASPAPAAQ